MRATVMYGAGDVWIEKVPDATVVEPTVALVRVTRACCDGAVGLCGVIAAKRLGAEQIILLGRHEDRIALAREFGATDVVSERGDAAIERVRELTGGYGATPCWSA
jgi:threonine dehydrogenase-like Zn-dependent dehydrogenase